MKRFTEIGKKNYPKIHTEVPKIPNNPEVKELNLYDTSMKQMCRSMEQNTGPINKPTQVQPMI